MPKFTRQIVVFLDILGFSRMLPTFEEEALTNNSIGEDGYHESSALNKLLEIFQNAVSLVKGANCRSFQFSDNMGVSVNYITDDTENPDVFAEILALISLLAFQFVKEGYFIRGGVDAGWAVDADDVVAGMPLLNAYNLEKTMADFPRIMLSGNFLQTLKEYLDKGSLSESAASLVENYVAREGDLGFINIFFQITNFEDKAGKLAYLKVYSDAIIDNLRQFRYDEYIYRKYRWLAGEFNSFIDLYTAEDAYLRLDSDELEYSPEDIALIHNLKINIDDL